MQLTETQLRRTIRSILNELMTSRKGKKSWLQRSLEPATGLDYADSGYMGEADEDEVEETDEVE
jgi:hypothetical protein